MTSALNWYAREWHLIPQMPTEELWRRTMSNLHARAKSEFGEANAAAGWAQFQRNKGWF